MYLNRVVARESGKAQGAGDLDRIVALREFQEGWATGERAAETDDEFVQKLAAHAATQLAKFVSERDQSYGAMAQQYGARLKKMEQWLVLKKRVDEGLEVRAARGAFETDHAALLSRLSAAAGTSKAGGVDRLPQL